MSDSNAKKPSFGSKLNTQEYYSSINSIIAVLRPLSTLRTIALQLNTANFSTPSGLSWNRGRVANFLQSSAFKGN